jgi:uncharacterized protein YukE
MNTLPIDSATIEELRVVVAEVRDVESKLYSARVDRLLAEMKQHGDAMAENCQGQAFDPEKSKRWLEANEAWNRAHNELCSLQ